MRYMESFERPATSVPSDVLTIVSVSSGRDHLALSELEAYFSAYGGAQRFDPKREVMAAAG
jgi:hypothetical protein